MDKLATLTEILTQDPTNAFARYGLAMEHAGLSDGDDVEVENPGEDA